jgi:tRNA G37 N-methylase TrmD
MLKKETCFAPKHCYTSLSSSKSRNASRIEDTKTIAIARFKIPQSQFMGTKDSIKRWRSQSHLMWNLTEREGVGEQGVDEAQTKKECKNLNVRIGSSD